MSNTEKTYNKRALTIKEAAEFIGVSRGIIYHWLDIGILPYEEYPGTGKVKGRFKLIRKYEINRFLEKYHYTRKIITEKPVLNKKITVNEIILLPRKKY